MRTVKTMTALTKTVIIFVISLISSTFIGTFISMKNGFAEEAITISIVPQTSLPSNPPASPLSTSTFSRASYSPSSVCVIPNTNVTWINNDTIPHTVTFTNLSSFDSKNINPSSTFSHIFNKVGAYEYFDSNDKNTKGLVKVANNNGECNLFLKTSTGQ